MGEESQRKKTTRVVESLGWLTESSIMPQKQRAIAVVGPSSILELKAQLCKSQDESKKTKELSGPDFHFHRAKKILPAPNLFSAKNFGVDACALKDEEKFILGALVSKIISKLEDIMRLVRLTVMKKDCQVSLEGLREGVKGY